MQFRIIEFTETSKFQFLNIYKNGFSSVQKCIEDNFPNDFRPSYSIAKNKPRFAVIRDPYKRFISGLKYDLERHKVNIQDIKLDKLFTTNETHLRNTIYANMNHSASQMPYLMNSHVTHYIDIGDLNLFLKMHFDKVENINKSKSRTEEIEKHFDKNEIMKYLHLDYYIYNSILRSPFLWEWQHGKIF